MTEKSKRKTNPGRRLLMRLIPGIGMIVALVVAGVYLFRPTGAQIVFIAPDENGVDNIWIADLNDPENPRQMTFFETHSIINYYRASENNHILLYRVGFQGSNQSVINILHLQTGQNEQILTCDRCSILNFHPDGEWLAYLNNTSGDEIDQITTSIHILNLITRESYIVDEFPAITYTLDDPDLSWMGKTNMLVFQNIHNEASSFEYVFYNVEEHQMSTLNTTYTVTSPIFNNNGTLYGGLGTPNTLDGEIQGQLEFRSTTNPGEVIYTIGGRGTSIQDWHHDNKSLIVSELNYDSGTVSFELNLYNVVDGTKETLFSSNTTYFYPTFNHDGSQILYSIRTNNVTQLMVYDMETREEIALPLFGRNPQWVNGGR